MKERPILFSSPMVRAILSGQKTQTRRIVKPQRHPFGEMLSADDVAEHARELTGAIVCPFGRPGDRLWVKETTYNVEDYGWIGPVYVESDEGRQAAEWGYGRSDDPDFIEPYDMRKRPSLFMSRAMSRILLEIISIRTERLQDISKSDAIAEGCSGGHGSIPDYSYNASPDEHFMHIWASLNGNASWIANPWVWAVEFRRIEQ